MRLLYATRRNLTFFCSRLLFTYKGPETLNNNEAPQRYFLFAIPCTLRAIKEKLTNGDTKVKFGVRMPTSVESTQATNLPNKKKKIYGGIRPLIFDFGKHLRLLFLNGIALGIFLPHMQDTKELSFLLI